MKKENIQYYDNDQIIKKANEAFEKKSSLEEYKDIYYACIPLRYVLGMASILTGFAAIQILINKVITNPYLAAIPSFIILIAIEVILHMSSKKVFVSFFKQDNKAYLLLLIVSIFMVSSYVASYNLSIKGAELVHKRFDNSLGVLKSDYLYQKDSINTAFNIALDSVNNEMKSYKKSVTYAGRINIYNTANKAEVKRFSEKLSHLEGERIEALRGIKLLYQKDQFNTGKEYTFNRRVWVYIAICIELFKVFILLFISYYFYLINKEEKANLIYGEVLVSEPIKQEHHEERNLSINTPINTPLPIGFKQDGEDTENTSTVPMEFDIERTKKYLNKYDYIVTDIQNDLSYHDIDLKYINTLKHVSKSTIQNVKRVLNNLDSLNVK